MTNNSPLDEHIKKQLASYSPDVPPHIWDNIITKKQKKRPFGLLFFLSGNGSRIIFLMPIIAACGILIFKPLAKKGRENHMAQHQPAMENAQEHINTKAVTSDKISEKKDQRSRAVGVDANTAASSNELTDNKKINTAGDEDLHLIVTAPATSDVNKKNTFQRKTAPAILQNVPISHINNHLQAFPKKGPSARFENTTAADETTAIGRTAKKFPSVEKLRIQVNNNAAVAENNNNDNGLTTSGERKNFTVSLEKYFLDFKASSEKKFSFHVKGSGLTTNNIPLPSAEKNAAGNKRYFELYAGPDYAFTKLRDTANSGYLQKRKQSTSFSSAFSAGIRYTKVFNNAVSFRTGINYSQVNETFKFQQGHIVQVVYIINDQGDTTGNRAIIGTRYKTTHNRYRTIDIPLLFGYETGNGRIHTNINAGIVINAYSWQKGDVLSNAFQPENITTGKANSPYQFKTNAGIGFLGGASFYYKLNSCFHLLAEPYFRYNFSAASKAAITLKQKFTTTGLKLGVRMDF